MLKLIIFDLDGTIADTLPMCIEAIRAGVQPYVAEPLSDEQITRSFGMNEEGIIMRLIEGDYTSAVEGFYRYYEERHEEYCPAPFEGMVPLLRELKERGLLVTLVTGKGARSCDISLKQFGIDDIFDSVETGSAHAIRKAEAIKIQLDLLNITPQESVYIGDAISDITECRKVDVECLSAAWADCVDGDELEPYNPGRVIWSIDELREVLLRKIER